MRRRQFITLLGGAAAWPGLAHGQPVQPLRHISVMMAFAQNSQDGQRQASVLRESLQELGWRDGYNIRIDFFWNLASPGRAQIAAERIIASQADLIVSHSVPVTGAAFEATKTIPIVFVNVQDPIGAGFIKNLRHPGGNVTGFINLEPSMGGKWVEILKEVDPRIRGIAILFNPKTAPAGGEYFLPSFKAACATLGIEPIMTPMDKAADIDQAISALTRQPNSGLVAMADIFTGLNRGLIIRSAVKAHLPFIAAFRAYPDNGGLISYGSDEFDIFRRAAVYVSRILKGEKPAELPVQAPTKFELVINLKTAKALGLSVPQTLLTTADEVIE